MQLLASVINISKSGLIIAKRSGSLNLDSAKKLIKKPLYSDKNEKIGYVSEVFGSVESPYISIKPLKTAKLSKPEKLLNSHVYIGEIN